MIFSVHFHHFRSVARVLPVELNNFNNVKPALKFYYLHWEMFQSSCIVIVFFNDIIIYNNPYFNFFKKTVYQLTIYWYWGELRLAIKHSFNYVNSDLRETQILLLCVVYVIRKYMIQIPLSGKPLK